jgi:hypothetical protein
MLAFKLQTLVNRPEENIQNVQTYDVHFTANSLLAPVAGKLVEMFRHG